ncbi:E3 ubiquitin-protein ligase RBBP6-like [Pseudophryne corroboree]|uniref:E3 ubiquitin-protein ligase RBBP6-like n=1 Tax=Pseudophryne corroboree TaxID=495146 RepID=UPI003081D1C5
MTLTQHRLSLAVTVLENMTMTSLVRQNLETFSILQTDLSKCEMKNSPKVEACLRHMATYTETVSAECLQEDVLLNLVWLLHEDLSSLIHGKPQEMKPRTKDSQRHKKRPVHKKHKGQGKHKKKARKANSRPL